MPVEIKEIIVKTIIEEPNKTQLKPAVKVDHPRMAEKVTREFQATKEAIISECMMRVEDLLAQRNER